MYEDLYFSGKLTSFKKDYSIRRLRDMRISGVRICFLQMCGWISEGGVQPDSCTRASIRALCATSCRCKTHKHSTKYAKCCTKTLVKYLSKCKFYKKKYSNTADSTENTVESSVLQSRNFHIKDHLHKFSNARFQILISSTRKNLDFGSLVEQKITHGKIQEYHPWM
jgi:hypothetical protein